MIKFLRYLLGWHDFGPWELCQKCQRDIRMGRITLPAVSRQKVESLENQLTEAMEYYDDK